MKKLFSITVLIMMVLVSFNLLAVGGDYSSEYFHEYDPQIFLSENKAAANTEFAGNDDIENQPFTRWIKREMGVVWKAKWNSADNETNLQKLKLAMVSGDLPDVVYAPGRELVSLANGGFLVSLEPLIEEYASPLTKYMIDQWLDVTNDSLFTPYTFNGKIYAIPNLVDVWASTYENNWIRKDILDELGQDVPQTLKDLEDILAAYQEKYPDAVGHLMDKNFGGLDTVMEAYLAYPKKWIEDEDGKLVYGSVQPEVKKGLQTLKKWYQNGWIDREFIVNSFDKAKEDLVAGNVLSVRGPWWYVHWPFPDLWTNLPDARMVPYPALTGPSGKRKVVLNAPATAATWGTAVTTACEHPEALIYQLNELFDSLLRSDKNMRSMMKEKYNYTFKYPYTEKQTPENPKDDKYLWKFDYEVPGYGFFNEGESHEVRSFGFKVAGNGVSPTELLNKYLRISKAVEQETTDQLTGEDKTEYLGLAVQDGKLKANVANVNMYKELSQEDIFYFNKFTRSATKTMIDKNAYLEKLENEAFAKIIMGDKPVDYFDQFVESWRKSGGDQITREVNTWYENIK